MNLDFSTYARITEDRLPERRFRASIYVDVWVEATDNPEADRARAEAQVEEYRKNIPNSYVGGVAVLARGSLALDRDI